jgi:chromosome segregation ATPase
MEYKELMEQKKKELSAELDGVKKQLEETKAENAVLRKRKAFLEEESQNYRLDMQEAKEILQGKDEEIHRLRASNEKTQREILLMLRQHENRNEELTLEQEKSNMLLKKEKELLASTLEQLIHAKETLQADTKAIEMLSISNQALGTQIKLSQSETTKQPGQMLQMKQSISSFLFCFLSFLTLRTLQQLRKRRKCVEMQFPPWI